MASLLDAATLIAVAAALIYYIGWYYLWLFRRCFAAHKLEIGLAREYYLVIAAWCLNWGPFYAFFIAAAAAYLVLPGAAPRLGIWLSSAFMAVFPHQSLDAVAVLSIDQGEDLITLLLTAAFVYALHQIIFRRVCQVFAGARKQGFAYFPEVTELLLAPQSGEIQKKMEELAAHIARARFRILFHDTEKVVLFRFEDDMPEPKVAVVEVAAKSILAICIEGEAHFAQAVRTSQKTP